MAQALQTSWQFRENTTLKLLSFVFESVLIRLLKTLHDLVLVAAAISV